MKTFLYSNTAWLMFILCVFWFLNPKHVAPLDWVQNIKSKL